jgi:outer membrane protein OmpA-like peptidoglycan-associated protein/tetratricopeptide (TPR) repeat protein
MKKLFTYTIIFLGIAANVIAQEKSNKEKKGDKYYFVYSFNAAIDCYTHTKQLTPDGQRKLAKSYQSENKDTLAEIAYAKLIKTSGGNLSEDFYAYAMILKDNGKYEESNKYMDKYIVLKPNDLRSTDYISNKATLPDLLKDNSKYAIMHLDFNTDAEDFGTAYYKNKIVFTSSRATPKLIQRKSNRNGKPYLNMYVSEVDKDQMKSPSVFDEKLNGKWNNGPASFSKDGNFMAYTRNNYELTKKDRIVKLEIYFRTNKDGKWSEPEAFMLNNKDYSVGQPCLTADGNTMYFTSDMPGGFGGTDIYRIKKDAKGIWETAENMGDKLNTEGDEMFPFFEENNGVLFFTSDGRFGLGGDDIFICRLKDSKVDLVCNAGSPLNTSYDDFALITNDKANKGYFSSNRKGGNGDDDIYSIDIVKLIGFEINKQVKGIAKDKNDSAVPYTFITLLTDSNKILDTLTTKADGNYSFAVSSDKKYKLVATQKNYLESDTGFNTLGKEPVVNTDIILIKKEDNTASKIVVGADLAKILNLDQSILQQPIYFDLNKYSLRPDAIAELAKIIKVMNEYPEMVVELRSYTDCRGTKEYNQVLSNERAKVSADYLKVGITKPERIYGKGYGETNLVNSCACEGDIVSDCSEEEHQKNRRTEFIIMKKQ